MQNANDSINEAIDLLKRNGYAVMKNMGVEAPGYFPYHNNWSIYQPWRNHPLIDRVASRLAEKAARTLVPRDRLYTVHRLLANSLPLQGEIWEAGVYQGGSALLICEELRHKGIGDTMVRLFDTYEGMPETHPEFDLHKKGAFADTSLETVVDLVGSDAFIEYRKGMIPETFSGLEDKCVKFAHIDLDIYDSIKDACEFIWPRLVSGGAVVFDDYGYATCPGARKAIDEYFKPLPVHPLVLPTGQAIIVKP